MDFDFENYYTNYSTKELLKIMEKQQDYRPEAIAVIQNILAGRSDISTEEIAIKNETLDDFFEKHRKQEQFQKRFAAFYDILALAKKPSLIKQEGFLLLFIRVVLFFYYIIFLPGLLKAFYYILKNPGDISLLDTAIIVIRIVSTPFVIYLLSLKNKNGWIFSGIGKCIELSSCMYNLWFLTMKVGQYMPAEVKLKSFFYLLLIVGIIVLLFYRKTQQALKINQDNRNLVFITSGLTVLVVFIVLLIYAR